MLKITIKEPKLMPERPFAKLVDQLQKPKNPKPGSDEYHMTCLKGWRDWGQQFGWVLQDLDWDEWAEFEATDGSKVLISQRGRIDIARAMQPKKQKRKAV